MRAYDMVLHFRSVISHAAIRNVICQGNFRIRGGWIMHATHDDVITVIEQDGHDHLETSMISAAKHGNVAIEL